MNLCLKTLSQSKQPQEFCVTLNDRLPQQILSPCTLQGSVKVDVVQDGYQLTFDVCGNLNIACLRCLAEFAVGYARNASLMVYFDETIASRRLDEGDCVVVTSEHISLIDILTDDLHLFSPEKHEKITDCDEIVKKWII